MYDYVFITHLPAFYKVNLYNKLAEKLSIFVIFVGKSSSIRTSDFTSTMMNFGHIFLSDGNFESRSRIITSFTLIKHLLRLKFKYIIVGGWDLIEFWIAILLTPKFKNAIALESSINESTIKGIKSVMKRFFVSRISLAFPSGELHYKLLRELNYNNRTFLTNGVGIFPKKKRIQNNNLFRKKALYVGRLSNEKNLEFLVNFFNKYDKMSLTIVGSGPQKKELKDLASNNVSFIDHVDNDKINEVYLDHDIFILPSKSEPWGLVIDEAMYYGLPVIVSKNVGASTQLITNYMNGIILDSMSDSCLEKALESISSNYSSYKLNVQRIDFEYRDQIQTDAYVRAVNANIVSS